MHSEILAVPADLLFAARIRAAAEPADANVFVARNAKTALEHLEQVTPALIIVDLDARGWDPVALIRELKSRDSLKDVPVLSYVSHVREDLIEAARNAGAKVMARGAFARNMAEILGRVKQSGG